MATGLAARIKEIFGFNPQVVEGHNGIYEVSVRGQVVATNKGKCSSAPTEDEILSILRNHISPLPGKEKMVKTILPMV